MSSTLNSLILKIEVQVDSLKFWRSERQCFQERLTTQKEREGV